MNLFQKCVILCSERLTERPFFDFQRKCPKSKTGPPPEAGTSLLFTDNYYTSEELMDTLYEDYKILLVGTVKLTKKKSRTEADYPYAKLSGPAKKLVEKGWTRWAQKEVKGPAGNTVYVEQATTWMDKKQVGILHNWLVGPPGDCQMLRWDSNKRERVPVDHSTCTCRSTAVHM